MIPDDTVSRIHARIFRKNGMYFISDMGSKNGTTVDGETLIGKGVCLLVIESGNDVFPHFICKGTRLPAGHGMVVGPARDQMDMEMEDGLACRDTVVLHDVQPVCFHGILQARTCFSGQDKCFGHELIR